MARYIDAEIPISHIDDDIAICKGEEFVNPSASANKMGLQMAKNYIHATPTADVAEVKHGEWVDRDGKTWCSLCEASNKQYKPPYCPHCGAKMDGGEVK